MEPIPYKQIAAQFLVLASGGKSGEAFSRYVGEDFRHHLNRLFGEEPSQGGESINADQVQAVGRARRAGSSVRRIQHADAKQKVDDRGEGSALKRRQDVVDDPAS